MMKSLLLPAAILALGFAGQASAARVTDASAQSVNITGVNFRDPVSVRSLYERIERAARRACATGWPDDRIGHHDTVCIDDAVNRAVLAANRPMLTAFHESAATTATATR